MISGHKNKASILVISSLILSVFAVQVRVVEASSDGVVTVGSIILSLCENYWTKQREQDCTVDGYTTSGTADGSRRIAFAVYLFAEDDAWWHGANYLAEMDVYKDVGAGQDWQFIGSDEWTKSTGNLETFEKSDTTTLRVQDTMGIHEPTARYYVYLHGKIGQSGPGYDEDDAWATVDVTNPAATPYQQVMHVDPISSPKYLGDTVDVSGYVDTADHQGEPVSSTRVRVYFNPHYAGTQESVVYTDSTGHWSTSFQIPYSIHAIGTGWAEAYDDAKTGYYLADSNGDKEYFEIETRLGQNWFELSITPIKTKTVEIDRNTQYTILITSIEFSGSVTLTVSGLPSHTSASFNPNPVQVNINTTASSTMTISTSGITPTGKYTPIISGTSGSKSSQTKCILRVIGEVGGVWVPVDKLGLLAPYIGVASTIVVATAATAIYAKRVKRRKEKR